MMVGSMITVMEMMINVMTVSWLPVLSVLLIIRPISLHAYPVQGHGRSEAYPSMHEVRREVDHRVITHGAFLNCGGLEPLRCLGC